LVDEVGSDLVVPLAPHHPLRGIYRLLAPLQIAELHAQIRRACEDFRPDVILVYKGNHLDASLIGELKRRYAPVVNYFPDASPHLFGGTFLAAMGEFDLVISAKRFHPPLWRTLYGYQNACVHVPQGYDPGLHLRSTPSSEQPYDVVLAATWRPEYERMVLDLMHLQARRLKIAIAGGGWTERKLRMDGLSILGVKPSMSYVEWLRRGKVVLAPVMTEVAVSGPRQPGDQITDRTFQCAAAHTFFIHRRTQEAREYYDEATEVPMFDDATELSAQLDRFLNAPDLRLRFAAAAHKRAVPAYSIDGRAAEVRGHLAQLIGAMVRAT
jgi:spore maturation protein CgeB